MPLTATADTVLATSHTEFERFREHLRRRHHSDDGEVFIDSERLDAGALRDLAEAARSNKDNKTARAAESILLAREGNFAKAVPSFKAFAGVLAAYLKHEALDGWIYSRGDDGKMYPYLVTNVSAEPERHNAEASVVLRLVAYGRHQDGSNVTVKTFTDSVRFTAGEASRRNISDILANHGLFKETAELRRANQEVMERFDAEVRGAFAKQFRTTGAVEFFEDNNWKRRGMDLSGRRVVHDLAPEDFGPFLPTSPSFIFAGDETQDGAGDVPVHPLVRVFDLKTHEFYWMHAGNLSLYQYDKSLRDKLVLRPVHRKLLNVLTNDLDKFRDDIIEGKVASNVILCRGPFGTGKTLTAEVYSELTERPLYSMHSGNLGITASEIHRNLQVVFERSRRWDCALLLDEADVFLVERGDNLQQNAIVAEFLRTLEYHAGLLFMTTNRSRTIDGGILGRVLAIIDYDVPSPEEARQVWHVIANQFGSPLSDDLVGQLVDRFDGISSRDIKMLLSLALRMASALDQPLSLDLFTDHAPFRGISLNEGGKGAKSATAASEAGATW